MLTSFEAFERGTWEFPCFRNDETIILSDSQFRRLTDDDLRRIRVKIDFTAQNNIELRL